MQKEIAIPSMGESISEVVISAFLKQEGSRVAVEDELLEIETDKVNQVLYASDSGIVHYTVQEGDSVSVGDVIGYIDTEEAPSPQEPPQQPMESPPPEEKKEAEEEKPPIRKGREEFLQDITQTREEKRPPTPVLEVPGPVPTVSRRKMSQVRKIIASRLVNAQQKTAMLTTFTEVDMGAVIRLRTEYRERFEKDYGVRLGFMSFFVRAVVSGLKRFPELHSFIEGDEIVQPQFYDIGIAVATDRGLLVPVVRDCEHRSFAQIEQQIDHYAKGAREGKLSPNDLRGGSFTITNGGVYGSLLSTPILNPPQSGILGMHTIQKRPIAIDDAVVIRPMMYVALSYDHRIVDGKEAVLFLVHLKQCIEDPATLLLES